MAEQIKWEDKSDEEVVVLTLQNQDYFVHLMNRYEAPLLRYIIRISGVDYEDAQDVLQEVYIKVYKNLTDFDTKLKFYSWIYSITHNQVISEFRKRQSRPQGVTWDTEDYQLNNLVSELDADNEIKERLNRENLDKLLNTLDIKYRDVLVLKFIEGKDYQEISDIIKKPVGTVGTLINRAKHKLRQYIIQNQLASPYDE